MLQAPDSGTDCAKLEFALLRVAAAPIPAHSKLRAVA